VAHRTANGPFKTRHDLRRVRGVGDKVFEQCAGFLRIPQGTNALDTTGVHPEDYDVAVRLIGLVSEGGKRKEGTVDSRTLQSAWGPLRSMLEGAGRLSIEECAAKLGTKVDALRDMASFLCDPGRDVRGRLSKDMLWRASGECTSK